MDNAKYVTDEIAERRPIYKTTNYAQFRDLGGNRIIKDRDVKSFAKMMKEKGNLTHLFPVEVNENYFVLDGQKRLAASKLNHEPVHYVILAGGTVDTVIARNTNMKAWDWRDFTHTYAVRGNKNYVMFQELVDDFKLPYQILLRYAGQSYSRGKVRDHMLAVRSDERKDFDIFREGEFIMHDYANTRRLLGQAVELAENSNVTKLPRAFYLAAYAFMATPNYQHGQMLKNIRIFGQALNRCYLQEDFVYAFEDIYKA